MNRQESRALTEEVKESGQKLERASRWKTAALKDRCAERPLRWKTIRKLTARPFASSLQLRACVFAGSAGGSPALITFP